MVEEAVASYVLYMYISTVEGVALCARSRVRYDTEFLAQ